jgi:hydrogenase maturation protease
VIRVIGVGTERGDDAAGLRVAERLRRATLPPGTTVYACERPSADLLDAFGRGDTLILVDAMRSGRAPGTVRRIDPADLAPAHALSSHGLGPTEALALAGALRRGPARVELVGIEAGEGQEGAMSPAVHRAVEEAAELVEALLGELAAPRDA